MKLLISLLGLALFAYAQNDKPDGDQYITVPAKYVSPEGLSHQKSSAISEWAGIGREIGIATKEGLSAVVDEANHFGNTRVGNFVMFLVAWKIIGHQLFNVVLGIPICIGGVALWVWSMRRFFFGRRVVVKKSKEGTEYSYVAAYKFESSDAKAGAGWVHGLTIVGWLGMFALIIFG